MDAPFKIIVDSRNAIEGHGGRFSFQLPEAMQVPKNYVCYVSQASVSNSFLTTGTFVGSRTNTFYWCERVINNATVFNYATLPEQKYDAESLAGALQLAINNASWFGGGNHYTVTYNESRNTFLISIPSDGSRSFFVPDDSLMELPQFQAQVNPRTAGYAAWTPNWSNLQSCMGLFGLGKRSSEGTSYAAFEALLAAPHLPLLRETGSIDVRRLHNAYIRSRALSSNNIIGPPDAQTLICKIPVTEQPGDILLRYHNGAQHDYIACGGRTLNMLDFFVTDFEGNEISLRGGTLSLELLFCNQPL